MELGSGPIISNEYYGAAGSSAEEPESPRIIIKCTFTSYFFSHYEYSRADSRDTETGLFKAPQMSGAVFGVERRI